MTRTSIFVAMKHPYACSGDDRFAPDIKTCIDNDRAAGFFLEAGHQAVQLGVAELIDGLDARGVIDVRDGRYGAAFALQFFQSF